MKRLSEAALPDLPLGLTQPRYDRANTSIGIVHLGIGAFHRAHQAVYLDDRLAAGEMDWAICGASLRSPAPLSLYRCDTLERGDAVLGDRIGAADPGHRYAPAGAAAGDEPAGRQDRLVDRDREGVLPRSRDRAAAGGPPRCQRRSRPSAGAWDRAGDFGRGSRHRGTTRPCVRP